MIDADDFPKGNTYVFWEGGYEDEHLRDAFSFAPTWIPKDYIDFFRHYYGYSINGIETFTPGPALTFENELRGRYEEFRDNYPGREEFFPIAYLNGDSWAVYHKNSEGKVSCGRYDFSDDEWYGGAPFDSFEEFTKSIS